MKKHILCIGDSNTHGLCTDPSESADHGSRYNEEERWTCLLQKALGEEYLVIEEGLSGRTCVYDDPDMDSVNLLPVLHALLNSHEPLDLLILMLGTNDSKVKFNTDAEDCKGHADPLGRGEIGSLLGKEWTEDPDRGTGSHRRGCDLS